MPEHRTASFLLRVAVPATHADALLGDLLEMAGPDQVKLRGLLVQTLWSLVARSLSGFLLAAVLGGGGMVVMQSTFFASLALHSATSSQRAWGSALAALAGCLLIMGCFSAVRYGVRDRMSWLSLAFSGQLAAASLLWWMPQVASLAQALLLATVLVNLLARETRSAVLAVAVLLVLQFMLWFGGVGLLLKPLAETWRHIPVDATTLKALTAGAFVASYATLTLLTCVTYAKVRHRMYA